MVSAWATGNRLVLGQVKVDEKSNEITALPKLIKILELSGCIVTRVSASQMLLTSGFRVKIQV